MPYALRPFLDFSGGLNVDASPDMLADNELAVADNVDLDERGALNKRGGTVRLNEELYDVVPTQLFEWVRNDGSARLLTVADGKLYAVEEGSFLLTELCPVADSVISYVNFQDKLYFLDGEKYRYYDGSKVEDVLEDDDETNDLTPIRKCKLIVWHPMSFRFFAAGNEDDKTALYYSEPNRPGFFKETSRMHPATAEGPIVALAVIGSALLVFYKNGAYAWNGHDPESATWSKVPIGQGTAAPRTIAHTPSSLTFMGAGGIYAINPAIAGYNVVITPDEGMVTNLAQNRVTSIINEVSDPALCCAVYDARRECYYLAYQSRNSPGQNDRVLVYNWRLKAFTRYTGLHINDFCVRSNGDTVAATLTTDDSGNKRGAIIKLHTGFNDFDGRAVDFRIKTKSHQLDYPFFVKKFKNLYLASKYGVGTSGHISVNVNIDSRNQVIDGSILDESEEFFVWGDIWGKPWGFEDVSVRRAKIRGKGYRIQVEIVNSVQSQPFTLLGIAVQFKPTRKKGRLLDA